MDAQQVAKALAKIVDAINDIETVGDPAHVAEQAIKKLKSAAREAEQILKS